MSELLPDTIGKRIRLLRKEELNRKYPNDYPRKMTQEEFGELLGVSRNRIINMERNVVRISDRFKNLICNTFNVRREWLDDGAEPVFNDVDNIKTINHLFSQLDEELQEYIINHTKKLLNLTKNKFTINDTD